MALTGWVTGGLAGRVVIVGAGRSSTRPLRLTPRLPGPQVAAAVDAVLTHPAVARDLAAALRADPNALSVGAPPVVGRLVDQLRAHGAGIPEPACAVCACTGRPLARSDAGGVCSRCRRRQLAAACTRCGVVKPVAGRDEAHAPVCARCADRPQRACGRCGRTGGSPAGPATGTRTSARAATRCPRRPAAAAGAASRARSRPGRTRSASAAPRGAPRPARTAARTDHQRHAGPKGRSCDPCYTAALRRRGTCARCQQEHRLVAPPGPGANICADCAGIAPSHVCTDCGAQDKLYERGRCARCSLRRRAGQLLRAGAEQIHSGPRPGV